MRSKSDVPTVLSQALGSALRSVRKHRRLDQVQIAKAIGVSRRWYIDVEGGIGRMSLDQLFAFADATNSDGIALVAAALLGKPDLAVACADNKLMSILVGAADDFEMTPTGDISKLLTQEIVSASRHAFVRLLGDLEERQASETSLQRRIAELFGDHELQADPDPDADPDLDPDAEPDPDGEA